MNYFVHSHALVESKNIGDNTRIWAFSHIMSNVEVGENCNICSHTFIEDGVTIANNVTIKSGVYIWKGVKIHNNVFIGPNVTFTNDIRPRSKKYVSDLKETVIEEGASIGANVTVIAGHRIGKYAMIGAGAVVTKDIPNNTLWFGNPAVFRNFICNCGNDLSEELTCGICNRRFTYLQGSIQNID